MKKYELTSETKVVFGRTLHRIRALISFGNVEAGELGGWVEKEENLDHFGDAWVSCNARVSGNARVCGDAWVYGDAQVSGNARVSGNAQVFGDAQVSGNARVSGNAQVFGDARVYGDAWVYGDARVSGNARVCGDAQVCGNDTWMTFGPAGSRNDFTTFFACADGGIGVKCGCFHGNLDDFERKIQATHGDNMHAKVYRLAIEMAKERIRIPTEMEGQKE